MQASLGMIDGSLLCLGGSFHYWMYTGTCTVDCMTASLQHSCWGTKICLESHRVSMTTAYNWLPWEHSLLLAGHWPRLIREGSLLPACMPEALGGTVRDTTQNEEEGNRDETHTRQEEKTYQQKLSPECKSYMDGKGHLSSAPCPSYRWVCWLVSCQLDIS